MQNSNTVFVVVLIGLFFAIVWGGMIGYANIYNQAHQLTCNGTLVVGQGGLAKASCLDFNSLKKSNASTGNTGSSLKEKKEKDYGKSIEAPYCQSKTSSWEWILQTNL